jgi:tripartite-type tricarboxylate transporter receptor subunit TctC
MNEHVNKVLAMADAQERLDNCGAEDGGGSPERFTEFIHKEIVLWRQVVKDGNVKGDT